MWGLVDSYEVTLRCASCKRSLVRRGVYCVIETVVFGVPLFLRQYVEVACVMVLHVDLRSPPDFLSLFFHTTQWLMSW